MEKSINYLSRDFESIKSELIKFSNMYYPEMSNNFNDSSVGSWFIDLVSAVGDDLSYHTDRMYQETNVNSAHLKSSVLNTARTNGVKIPGPKASLCEVELSIELPLAGKSNESESLSQPNWDYAPIVKRTSIVGAGNYRFELTEDVNFNEQFNSDGISNRRYTPKRNNNGMITGYTVTKTTIVDAGSSRVYKKVLTKDDVKPFMEIILPEQNIMNVESIIFKETSSFKTDPQTYEYYIDEEEYMITNQTVATYRYFEVDSLATQYRFASQTNFAKRSPDNAIIIADEMNPESYEDYTETSDDNSTRTTRYFKGVWKPLTQKFITEYTDNGYVKVIFGGATSAKIVPSGETKYGSYITSKIINNDMLGVLPKAGWTMYVLYRVGGGVGANLGQGAISSVINANMIYPSLTNENSETIRVKGGVTKSLSVINKTTAVAGKDAPSVEEIKYLTKYAVSAQNRCVTAKDYKTKIMDIPPKYGCPFRCSVAEVNNKIVIPMLGMTAQGKLTSYLPQTLVNNIKEWLSHYKSINDYLEMRSGKIYNLGFELDVFVDKNYTTSDVISNIISVIKSYMDVNAHDMGEDIFIGDLEKEITKTDGVISLIDLRVYNIYNGQYSKDRSPLPEYISYNETCSPEINEFFNIPEGSEAFRIDLNQTDSVLYSDYNSMFEILNPSKDICIRVKLK